MFPCWRTTPLNKLFTRYRAVFFGCLLRSSKYLIALLLAVACTTSQARDLSRISNDNRTATVDHIGLLDAVRITLESSLVIEAQQQRLEAAAGGLTAAGGQFNTTSKARSGYAKSVQPMVIGGYYNNPTNSPVDVSEYNKIDYQLGLSKKFRTGIEIIPSVSMVRFAPNSDNTNGSNTAATVNLGVVIPLLKGFGEQAVAAQEIAASHEFDRIRYQLWQVVAQEIEKTVFSYWAYVAAVQQRDIWLAARQRNRVLLENGTRLVQGDETPASDLDNYRASLARAEADLANAEQQVIAARYQLGMVMGIPADHFSAIPPPSDAFPKLDSTESTAALMSQSEMTEYALTHRSDLLAADQGIKYQGALMAGAENALRPQLNLQMDMGYQGLSTKTGAANMFTAYGSNIYGFTGGANISYEFPFANEQAIGQLRQVNAALTEAQILRDNLARSVVSAVQVASNNVAQRVKSLAHAITALESREDAFDSEKRKLEAGMSTVINVGVVEQNLTQAQLEQVDFDLNLANAVIRYRLETGSLFSQGDESRDIDLKRLTSIPTTRDLDMRAE
jgi:outer membrane protein TolC